MTTPRTERIERLPGWAQRYIEGLEGRAERSHRCEDEPLTRREARSAVIVEDTEARRWGDRK